MTDNATITCPKCGHTQAGGVECSSCGVLFAKARNDEARPIRQPAVAPPPTVPEKARRNIPVVPLLVLVVTIALVVLVVLKPPVGDPAEGAPAEGFRDYRRALADGDFEAMRDRVAAQRRTDVDSARDAGMLEMVRDMAPPDYRITGADTDGDRVTLHLTATVDDQPMTGTADMVLEEGEWRLDTESWQITVEIAGDLEVESVSELTGGRKVGGIKRLDRSYFAPGLGASPLPFPAQESPQLEAMATLGGHTDAVNSLAFSPDGRYLVSVGWGDMTLCLWRVVDGVLLHTIETQWRVSDVAMSPNGATAYTLDAYCHVIGWPLHNERFGQPREIGTTVGHETKAMAVSRNGRLLATVGFEDQVGRLSLWDLENGSRLRHETTPMWLHSVAISSDGRVLAVAGKGPEVWLWHLSRGDVRAWTVRGPSNDSEVYGLAFSPDGRFLATGHNDSSVSVWEILDGRQASDFFVRDASVMDLAFSADGRVFATAHSDANVYLWESVSGQRLATLQGHLGVVRSVAFDPTGTALASGSEDKTIIIWR